MGDVATLLVHLRLPFQLMLAPFVLLGALTSGGAPHAGWLVGFLAIHVGLYGGATAYNAYFDRDEGPIGLLRRPPPVRDVLRDGGLWFQGLAVLVLCALAAPAGGIALLMMGMGIAYSHPRWRWKRSAALGLLAVGIGQGSLAVYLGFYAMGGAGAPPPITHHSAAASALVAMGLFPITQVYQIEEDERRGDRTLPVRVGWRRALLFAFAVTSGGSILLALALADVLWRPAALGVALSPLALGAALGAWALRFEGGSSEANHDWAMGIALSGSAGFWIVLALAFGARGGVGPEPARADGTGAFDEAEDAGALPAIRIRRDGDAVEIEATLEVGHPPDRVWPVVLDYDHLASFMPNLDSSRVIARDGERVRVRQVGGVRFVFSKTYRFELELERVSPERVTFRRTAGDLEGYSGEWRVEPTPRGSRIVYAGRLEYGLGAPWFLGRSVLHRSIRRMMPALGREMDAREGESVPDG